MSDTHYTLQKNVNLNQLRIESCIGTILTIKKKIKTLKNIDPVFVFQFNKLESIIPQIKMDDLTEREVEKIEDATNNLFDQMKTIFSTVTDTSVYEGIKH